MSFRSPWRHRPFVGAVAAIRRVLRPFGDAENAFIRFLVQAHNRRIDRWLRDRHVSSVLLILPRCVKRHGCPCDVRAVAGGSGDRPDVNRQGLAACRDCNRCPLGAVARFTERYGVRAVVAYRSHIAYAIAREERPDLTIAVACEDRLVKALRSVPEVPALLSPLTAMERPCRNADCDLGWIEGQLRRVVGAARSLGPHPAARADASDPSPAAGGGTVRSAQG